MGTATANTSETTLRRTGARGGDGLQRLLAGVLFGLVTLGLAGAVGVLALLLQARPEPPSDPAAAAQTLTGAWPAPTADAGAAEPFPAGDLELGSREVFTLEVPAGEGEGRVPWTLYLLPESPGGEEYVLTGTMAPPAGMEPGKELQMVIYYSGGGAPEWLDPTGLVRTPEKMPDRVASQVLFFVTPSEEAAGRTGARAAASEPTPAAALAWDGPAADSTPSAPTRLDGGAAPPDPAPAPAAVPVSAPWPAADPARCFGKLEVGL